jgi:hypothetical protein
MLFSQLSGRTEMMQLKCRMRTLAAAGVLGAFAFAGAIQAAPGDNGKGVGGCIDNLYGNATNPRPSGHGVLPSQSPGPFVNTGPNEPPRNDRLRGLSVGDVMQIGHEVDLTGHEIIDIICTFP